MSVQAMSWVLDHSESRLAARLVLLSIANHANEHGEQAWPLISTIAREAHVSERQAQRAIQELVTSQELFVWVGVGPRRSNVYQVLMKGDNLSPSRVTNPTVKGDKSGSAIRKNRPEPPKTLTPLPPLTRGVCELHPNSGLTTKGNCFECYSLQHSSEAQHDQETQL